MSFAPYGNLNVTHKTIYKTTHKAIYTATCKTIYKATHKTIYKATRKAINSQLTYNLSVSLPFWSGEHDAWKRG